MIPSMPWVLAVHINDLLRGPDLGAEPNRSYYAALDDLTAEGWLQSG